MELAEFDPSRILYNDGHIIAVNKRAGELVVADRWGLESNVLLHQVGAFLRAAGHKPDEHGRDLYAVHRLDRETSGVVLFAKHHDAHRALSIMFETREMEKRYWAWCSNCPSWREKIVELPLIKAKGKHGKGRSFVDHQHGKPSETRFTVLGCYGDIVHFLAEPYTGRSHQIRVHAKEIGFPLLLDHLYVKPPWQSRYFQHLPINRIPLHAIELRFKHPFTSEEINLTAGCDYDLVQLQEVLTKRFSS